MDEGESNGETVVRRERFAGGPAREFLSSMAFDDRLFAADLAVDRAHVVMLEEQDVVSESDAAAIWAALDAVEADGFDALPDGEDVHEAIETAVVERVGPAGGRMHTARSRNDEVATCLRVRYREDLLDALEAVVDAREAFCDVAAANVETVMPGFTHLQPAQPTTVAHWALSYESALARDTERLFESYARTNRSPLGAAAFAGTPFDVDRERTADLLGFDAVLDNSMDAVSARDFLVEGTAAFAGLATTLAGLAEDVVVFANRGLVHLDDDYASTSSIMPQKVNPDTLELVRSVAGDATGGLQALLTTLKGLPRAYNRDLQNASPHAWRVAAAVTEATGVAAGAVATAEWPVEALAAAAGEGFATATGVADLLATCGVPFRTAHEVVAAAATEGADYDAIEAACRDVLDADLTSIVDRETVEAALDPATSAASRDSAGGPAPPVVEAALADARTRRETDAEAAAARREDLAAAAESLAAEVATRA